MSFAENQRIVFTVTGDFSLRTVLSRAELKRDPRVGERVEVKSEGSCIKGESLMPTGRGHDSDSLLRLDVHRRMGES